MGAPDMAEREAGDGPPSADEAKAILHRLSGPYVQRTVPDKTAVAPPDDSALHRDVSRFKAIESLFGSLPEALPDPLIVVNQDGAIVLTNMRTAEMFGYRPEELLGAPVELLMPLRFRPQHVGHRNSYFLAPRARPMGAGIKLFGLRKDGSEFPVEISLNPLPTPEGLVVVSTIRDISARVRLEARYRTLVEEIPAVTFMAALDEGVSELYVSPQIEKLLGFSQQEWLEDPLLWYRQLHPDDQTRWHTEFARTCATGGPFRAEYRFVARDGRIVWVLGEAKVVRDQTGRPLFMQGIAFDITKMKEAEENLERLVAEKTAELQQKVEELNHFNQFAGHELKKPLTHIKAELTDPMYLTRGRNQRAVREMADWVLSKAQDALNRIDAMLRWARVQDLHAKRLVPYDCRAVFATACNLLQETIAQTGADISCGPLPTVLAAAQPAGRSERDNWPELVFLFENLINNALKYRSPERSPRVRVEAQRQGGQWLFSFADNGIGIEPQYFKQIFELFQRLHSEHRYPGHGIGLAYCKRVVETLGGKIEVESAYGKGSTFHFTLPAAADDQPSAPAVPPVDGPTSAEPAPPKRRGRPQPAGKKKRSGKASRGA